jgi:hypothetical protein
LLSYIAPHLVKLVTGSNPNINYYMKYNQHLSEDDGLNLADNFHVAITLEKTILDTEGVEKIQFLDDEKFIQFEAFWEVFDGLKFTYEHSLMHRCVDKEFEKFYNPIKALKSRFEKIKKDKVAFCLSDLTND